jgi:hypothetical protein
LKLTIGEHSQAIDKCHLDSEKLGVSMICRGKLRKKQTVYRISRYTTYGWAYISCLKLRLPFVFFHWQLTQLLSARIFPAAK